MKCLLWLGVYEYDVIVDFEYIGRSVNVCSDDGEVNGGRDVICYEKLENFGVICKRLIL